MFKPLSLENSWRVFDVPLTVFRLLRPVGLLNDQGTVGASAQGTSPYTFCRGFASPVFSIGVRSGGLGAAAPELGKEFQNCYFFVESSNQNGGKN